MGKRINRNRRNSALDTSFIKERLVSDPMFDPVTEEVFVGDDEFEEYYPEEELKAMMDFIKNSRQQIRFSFERILSDFNITSTNNIYMFDLTSFIHKTLRLGAVFNSNDMTDKLYKELKSYNEMSHIIKDGNLQLGDFRITDEYSVERETAGFNIINHSNDHLFCPVCNSKYHDNKDIVYAQIASVVAYTMFIGKEIENNIASPFLTLTPICPKCYYDAQTDGEFNKANLTVISAGRDEIKGIVPLLPSCLEDKIKNPDVNVLSKYSNGVFWGNNQTIEKCPNILNPPIKKRVKKPVKKGNKNAK